MHLREVVNFVALAEALHFGRAAQQVGTTQPQLTRSIQKLEHELGVELVTRTTRHLALTAAGMVYLEEARKLLGQASLAKALARSAAATGVPRLRIGFIAPALSILTPALRSFRACWPKVELALEQRSSDAQLQGLRDGSLDVALLSTFRDTSGLILRTVRRDKFFALVPSDWPIARKRRARLMDFAELPFIVAPYERSPVIQSAILLACKEAGFAPRISQTAVQAYTIEGLVSAGVGIALQPEIYRAMPLAGVTYLPVVDLPDYLYWELAIAWVGRNRPRPVLDDLVTRVLEGGKRPGFDRVLTRLSAPTTSPPRPI